MSEHENLDTQEIKQRSVRGVVSLTIRRIILRGIAFLVSIILFRIMSPDEMGIFTIISFIVTFFGNFSDVGLAAALIQKKEVRKEDLRTTFFIQTLIVGTLVLLLILMAPYIVTQIYGKHLDPSNIALVQVLGFTLLLSSLRTIPAVLLERKLQFNKLVIPEVVETLVYSALVLALAYAGFSVWSFVIAILVRGIVGVTLMYILAPWPVGIAWNKSSIKQLFTFGVPFQLNNLLALVKDNVVPTYVGAVLGPANVAMIGATQRFAFLPLEALNDIIRVTFPTYSRLQHDPDLLKRALEKTLYFISLALFPMLAILAATAPWIFEVVLPKYRDGLPLFYFFCVNTFFACLSTTFTNALFAIGKSRIVLYFMIFWTIITWILIPLCSSYYGVNGVGLANAIIATTSIVVVVVMKRHVDVDIKKSILANTIYAALTGISTYFLTLIVPANLFTLILVGAMGGCIYLLLQYLFSFSRFQREAGTIIKAFAK